MTKAWEFAQIGAVAKPVVRAEEPQTGTLYRQVGVRLWGQGAYERESIDGSQTKYKTLSRVESGDIIVNKIWARNGSVAVINDDLDGCFGSGEFPTFASDTSNLEPKWFHWITKTSWFWDACDKKSQGTSGKNRIRPEKFLEIEIPLPPLTEQRRIVAHIESLAARVHEAQRLREEAREGTEALLHSSMRQIFKLDGAKIVPLETTCAAIIDNLHSNPDYSGDCVVPCIRSSDVGWGELFLETARKTSEAEYTHRTIRGEPTENDIVLVREGGGTGKAALVEKHHRFSLGQRVMMLRPNPDEPEPKRESRTRYGSPRARERGEARGFPNGDFPSWIL